MIKSRVLLIVVLISVFSYAFQAIGQKKEAKTNKEVKPKPNFCDFATNLLQQSHVNFKDIKGKLMKQTPLDGPDSLYHYASKSEWASTMYTTIFYSKEGGYTLESEIVETDQLKDFTDTYNKYKKLLSACETLKLDYVDSTFSSSVKKCPKLSFIGKTEKMDGKNANIYSVQLVAQHFGDAYYLFIEVQPRKK